MRKFIGFGMLMLGVSSFAMAGTTVPEIDATTGAAAIALLSGGLMVLRGRRKK